MNKSAIGYLFIFGRDRLFIHIWSEQAVGKVVVWVVYEVMVWVCGEVVVLVIDEIVVGVADEVVVSTFNK